jgi:hypothetical protein
MKAFRSIPIDLHARRAYPFMAGMVLCVPGVIIEDEASGLRVRIREDGSLEEIRPGGHPHAGAAYDPANVREKGTP